MTTKSQLEIEDGVLAVRGCPLAYWVCGEGVPVVFIQGVGVHGNGWVPQVQGMAHRCRCLWFDNRGMGLSQPARMGISVETMATDTLALMDALGWESAHVVGHSLGGLAALHVALSARARVRSLSLLCTSSRGRDALRMTPWMIWVGLRTRIGPRSWRRRAFLQIVMPLRILAETDRGELAANLATLFGHDLADQPAVVAAQLAALKAYDATRRLGELKGLPTLVVSAKYDPLFPPSVGWNLAWGIEGSRHVKFPDAAHGVTIQCADRINALLLEHIAAVEAGNPI